MLAVCVLLLTGLGLTYYFVQNNRNKQIAGETGAETTGNQTSAGVGTTPAVSSPSSAELAGDAPAALLSRSEDEIAKVTFENEKGTFTFTPREVTVEDTQEWTLVEQPSMRLTSYTVSSMINPSYNLTPAEKLLDATDNAAEFGFDNPAKVTAQFTDGSTSVLSVGSKTPDGGFYYAMVNDDPAVYLIQETVGSRVFNGYNEIINKGLPQVDLNAVYYVYIKEKNKAEMELKAEGTLDEFQEQTDALGGALMDMLKPYPDRDMYMSYFVDYIGESFNGYTLGELVEVNAEDLSKYGLDDPELTLVFEGAPGKVEFLVGNIAPSEEGEEERVYVTTQGNNNVFLMRNSYFKSFRDIRPIKFVDRFILTPLPNIGTVNTISINSREFNRNNELILNHADNPPKTDGTGEFSPTVDGVNVESEAFRGFYRVLIGLAADVEVFGYEITEEPLVEITMTFNDGRETSLTRYYPYNADFYAARLDEGPVQFLVNKALMNAALDSLDSIQQ